MGSETFILETENENIECTILMTLELEEYKKKYLVYTDNTENEEKEPNIFVSSYEPEKNNELNDITDELELEKVSNYIEKIWREQNE